MGFTEVQGFQISIMYFCELVVKAAKIHLKVSTDSDRGPSTLHSHAHIEPQPRNRNITLSNKMQRFTMSTPAKPHRLCAPLTSSRCRAWLAHAQGRGRHGMLGGRGATSKAMPVVSEWMAQECGCMAMID